MTVLQAGVPRSGNSLLYKALSGLYREAGAPWRSYIAGHAIQQQAQSWELSLSGQAQIDMVSIEPLGCHLGISSGFRELIRDFPGFVESCSLVWTHSPYDPGAADKFATFDQVLYIVRDPRDALVSMAHFHYTDYSRKVHHVSQGDPDSYIERAAADFAWYWVKHVVSFLAARKRLRVQLIRYEDLVRDLSAQLSSLAELLGLHVPTAGLDRLLGELDFRAMQASSPQHLRSGRPGVWRVEMSTEQVAHVERIAGQLMESLGYSLTALANSVAVEGRMGPESDKLRPLLAAAAKAARGSTTPGWTL
ncbi:MAG: sulfotransferase domain-containing protein [Nocardioides sp.]|uniref:sulfotransferase domain-containing protein n=1 Tax=Nocardioides sp. TaxID=35761 RepID=UPI0039E4A1DB